MTRDIDVQQEIDEQAGRDEEVREGRAEGREGRGPHLGLGTFQPGWKWSKDVKPIAKTESCQVHHVGYVISGRMSGSRTTAPNGVKAGDVTDLGAGHDAWVVGKETVVIFDITSGATYAKK